MKVTFEKKNLKIGPGVWGFPKIQGPKLAPKKR